MISDEQKKEMLTLCAKAIGFNLDGWEYSNDGFYRYSKNGTDWWNPYEDDYFLLDIIFRLKLKVKVYTDNVNVFYYHENFECLTEKWFCNFANKHNDGKHDALRAAIVECAAVVGKHHG